MATNRWQIVATEPTVKNPIKRSKKRETANAIATRLTAAASGVHLDVTAEYDQVLAQGNVAVASTGSGAQKITVNGIDCPAASDWNTNTNTTAADLVTAINTTATDALVTAAVTSARVFRPASGYFTISGASGSLSPKVGGSDGPHTCTFTATGVDAADALLLAAAINAASGSGVEVRALPNYPTAGIVTCIARDGATGTLTLTGSAGTYTAVIGGISVSVAYDTSTTVTAAALAAAINLSCQSLVHATSATNVVTVVSNGNTDPIRVSGTGATVIGGAITLSSSAGDITATINGIATTVTYVSSDTATAALLAAALNAKADILGITQATSAAGVVSVWRESSADNAITLSGAGVGGATTTASAATLASAGNLYGGIPGNAITLTSATGVTRNAATLAGGLTSVALTAKVPGKPGNWITSAVTGDALTAASARLIGGTSTSETFAY